MKPIYYSDNDFQVDETWYERDPDNGRCYYLEDSRCLRADCDGKLVRHRIGKEAYAQALERCKLATKGRRPDESLD